jgi:hypothetical protein
MGASAARYQSTTSSKRAFGTEMTTWSSMLEKRSNRCESTENGILGSKRATSYEFHVHERKELRHGGLEADCMHDCGARVSEPRLSVTRCHVLTRRDASPAMNRRRERDDFDTLDANCYAAEEKERRSAWCGEASVGNPAGWFPKVEELKIINLQLCSQDAARYVCVISEQRSCQTECDE